MIDNSAFFAADDVKLKQPRQKGDMMSNDSNLLRSEAQFLFDQAMKLPVVERAKLADKLSSTVDPMTNQEWQAAWSPEIARRIADVGNGAAKLSSWEDARRRLWEGFDA